MNIFILTFLKKKILILIYILNDDNKMGGGNFPKWAPRPDRGQRKVTT